MLLNGFILIIPHAFKYLIQTLQGTISVPWFGIISFVLMIPLFITSFTKVRRKMSYKTWKLVQSPAYLIYALLVVHLILNYTEIINLVLYLILFSFYFVTKIIFEIKEIKAKQSQNKLKRQKELDASQNLA